MFSALTYINTDIIKSLWEEKTYNFNVSIEDNTSMYQIAKINNNDNVFIKTLGSCNIFNLLLFKPNLITTYDDNIYHNFLLELKIACMKTLNYNDYIDIFANMNREKFDENFNEILKYFQTDEAKKYIVENKNIFDHYLYSGKQTIQHVIKIVFNILQDKYPELKDNLDKAYENNDLIDTNLINKILDNDLETIVSNISKGISWYKYLLNEEDLVIIKNIDEQFIRDRVMSIKQNNEILNKNIYIFSYLYGKFKNPKLPSYMASIENFELVKSQLHKIYIFDGNIYEALLQTFNYNINKYFMIDDVFDYYDVNKIIDIIQKNDTKKYIIWKDKLEHNDGYHAYLKIKQKLVINSNQYLQKKLVLDKLPINKYINFAKIHNVIML